MTDIRTISYSRNANPSKLKYKCVVTNSAYNYTLTLAKGLKWSTSHSVHVIVDIYRRMRRNKIRAWMTNFRFQFVRIWSWRGDTKRRWTLWKGEGGRDGWFKFSSVTANMHITQPDGACKRVNAGRCQPLNTKISNHLWSRPAPPMHTCVHVCVHFRCAHVYTYARVYVSKLITA